MTALTPVLATAEVVMPTLAQVVDVEEEVKVRFVPRCITAISAQPPPAAHEAGTLTLVVGSLHLWSPWRK
jgi:hypothetical protein